MNGDQYSESLKQFEEEIRTLVHDAPFVKSQEILGSLLGRIFNRGEDSNGEAIASYTNMRYKALRQRRGLQINYVDLQFTGELFRSINTGTSGDSAVIGYTNAERARVANHLEERYGKPIFAPSEVEQEEAKELMIDYVKQGLRDKIKTIFGNG